MKIFNMNPLFWISTVAVWKNIWISHAPNEGGQGLHWWPCLTKLVPGEAKTDHLRAPAMTWCGCFSCSSSCWCLVPHMYGILRVLLIRDKSFSLIQACLCFVFVFASVCEYLAFSSVSTWFAGMSLASVVLIEEEAPALLQMKQVLMQSPSGTTETPLNWSTLFTMLMLMLLVIGKEGWKQTRPV